MMEDSVTVKVIDIISGIVGFDSNDILLEDNLRKELGMEQEEIDAVISAVEEKFNMTFDEGDKLDLVTVSDVIDCVEDSVKES